MLSDFLGSFDVRHYPRNARRVFRWFDTIAHENIPDTVLPSISDANLLYVCSQKDAPALLQQKPQAFVVILCEEGTAQLAEFESHLNRIVLIQQHHDLSYYILQVQSYFTRLLVWENELYRILLKRGTLIEMLDATTMVIDNFMFISDASLNIIASSSLIDPPDTLHEKILSAGRFTFETIEERPRRLPENEPYFKEPSGLSPYTRYSYPIYLDHIYFGSLSMPCHKSPLTEGLKDLFKILMKYVTPLCATLWRMQIKLDSPHYFFFEKILNHTQLAEDYLWTQTKLIGIDKSTEFMLATFYTESTAPMQAAQILRAASGLNQGSVICFPYQSNVLALFHSSKSEPTLFTDKVAQDITERVCSQFDAISSLSDSFSDIRNLDLAYQQTVLTLRLRSALERESLSQLPASQKMCRSFSEVIDYYLVSPGPKDERFMNFCFNNTLPSKLHEEDLRNGTRNLYLLWAYIHLGRNATAVASKLHMHRNTVLYHVEKIQKRYNLDLSSPTELDREKANFRAFFLRASKERNLQSMQTESRL